MPIKCPRCGLWNPPGTGLCDCGFSFAKGKLESATVAPRPVQPAVRSGLFLLAWVAALGALGALVGRGMWQYYVLFPLGLASWPGAIALRSVGIRDQVGVVLLGWCVYVMLAYPVLLARTRRSFLVAYVAMCVVLAMNVVGCYRPLR
jgi:hypothetical protein